MHIRFAFIICFAAVTAANAQIPTARVGDVTQLQLAMTRLQANMQTSSVVLNLSLLDFLR